MAIYHSKTLHQHSDYRIQQELERISKIKSNQTNNKLEPLYYNTGSGNSSEDVITNNYTEIINNYSSNIAYRTGTIKIDRTYPFNPMSTAYEYEEEIYIHQAIYPIRPENGYYGWAVYKILKHDMQLPERHRYIINFTQTRDESMNDEDFILMHPEEINIFQHYPIDENMIVIFAMYKPNIHTGTVGPINWLIKSQNIIKTNIMYNYLIIGI